MIPLLLLAAIVFVFRWALSTLSSKEYQFQLLLQKIYAARTQQHFNRLHKQLYLFHKKYGCCDMLDRLNEEIAVAWDAFYAGYHKTYHTK